ncbi:MAG TPA: histidine phosphatase family protein [Polyangia bacterium]|jgi:broad specificity phosphatase PhoE|nr:histidine phosphatase family protein [Polyangia bacterium]
MHGAEILLLRHGQSEGNEGGRFGGHGPTPLTALGRRQAEATARVLAAEGGLSAIFASDLPRAMQTAQPIVTATGIAMRTTPALRERAVGVFTGMTFAEAEAAHPEIFRAMMQRDPDACPPEGESSRARLAHVGAFFDETIERFGVAGRALFVSHAFTLNLLLRRVVGLAESPTVFFRTDNCALHRLRRSPAGFWNVEALNDRRHLVGVG